MRPDLPPWLTVMRPHQWLKNLLVFVPLVASHQTDPSIFLKSLCAFVAYCLVASSVYVINDVKDVDADRMHPRKRLRPFASGILQISAAPLLLAALLIPGAIIALTTNVIFSACLGLYVFMSTAYSFKLKGQPILDVCILASLYTWRIIAGGLATAFNCQSGCSPFRFFSFWR